MTRTTMAFDEDLLRRIKEKAAREGRTMQSVVNDLLRQALAESDRDGGDYRLELGGWEAEAQPGVDLLDRDKLFDLMEGR